MSKRIGRSPEEQALLDFQESGKEFVKGGAASYQNGNDFDYTKLGNVQQLGDSAYKDIATNPEYEAHQMEALRQLEEQSKDGYSARDKADLARIEQSANRANQGRQGAIKQNMAARGIGGGGLEVVMQQQAAQDAAEQQALQSLETNAQMQDRKMQATSQLGQLSGQLQNNQYNQQAQAAQAKDSISRFNTQNAVSTQQADNQGMNAANQTNYDRRNQVSDNNVNAGYTYRKDALGVGQQNAQQAYNTTMDQKNYQLAKKGQSAAKKSGQGAAIGTVIGGVAGAYFGGPMGAQAGAAAGGAIGGSFAHGGKIPGPELFPWDDPRNDVVPIMASGGERMLPKTVADDPEAAAKFVAEGVAKEKGPGSVDPRILDRLASRSPDTIGKYRAQLDSANQGVKDADQAAEYGQYANLIGKAATDFGNSQKSDTIYHNSWSKMGNAPEIDRAERKQYDGSGVDKLGAAGQSKAKERLAAIKASMAADYQAQKDMDKETEDKRRYEQDFGLKKDTLGQSDAHFNTEMGLKQWSAKQSADQFGQTYGLNKDKFGEEVRHNKADEGIKGQEALAKTAAAGAGKPLSGEQQSRYDSAAMGLKALREMGTALKAGDNTFTIPGMGDNNYTKNAAVFEEALGRMQSGGAIGKDEAAKFREMAPKATDSAEMQQTKLRDLQAEMSARIKSMGRDPEEAVRLRTPGASNQGGVVHGSDLPD